MTTLPTPPAGTYVVDAVHSRVGFIARHLIASKVRGHFTEFSGTITIGSSLETSSVEASAQTASVTTGNEMRDNHLKSGDFFELDTYPTLTFRSTAVKSQGENHYEMSADVTIHGVTKPVTFELEYLGVNPGMGEGVTAIAFEATTEIDRRDFDVNFQGALENGSLVVSNKITIEIEVEALSQTA